MLHSRDEKLSRRGVRRSAGGELGAKAGRWRGRDTDTDAESLDFY